MPADPSTDKLLITIAGSRQATALLPLIITKWKHIRLGVRSDASFARLKDAFPEAEIVKADLDDAMSVRELVHGVNIILHIGPSFHPREADVGLRVVDAAVAENRRVAGTVRHFIFSSVIGTQLSKLLNHDCKRLVEEVLMESNLPYTILQPTHRMDMLPFKMILAQPSESDAPLTFKANWKPENTMSFITMKDQVEAVIVVLEEREKHYYATYQLVSTPRPISYAEFVKRAVAQAGKKVEVGYKGFEESVDFYINLFWGGRDKVNPDVLDCLERMLLYYNSRGLLGNSNQLEWLIGRKGQTVEEWAQEQLDK